MKILTVDDSKTIRLIVAKAFKPYDCQMLEGANGVEGLAVAVREKPDIILLDYTMPIMDGFETLTRLRSDPDLKATPVIMLTAETGREAVLKIAKLGVRDYLIKPFNEETIVERVRRVVPLDLKSDAVTKPKRFDDVIGILIVDDKPAIVDQIRAGLADTSWKITGAGQTGQALDLATQPGVDIVLVSLSLPNNGATLLFQNLRGNARMKALPVFALSVKTATEEQARAQESGFTGIITKPVDLEELKAKVCRTLGLDTSYKYFQQRDGTLVLTLPREITQSIASVIAPHLRIQLSNAVDAGIDKMIIDLSQLQKADIAAVKLVLAAIQSGGELFMKHALIGSAAINAECRNYEESQSWSFARTFEEALARLGANARNKKAA